jgi:8-oxo-dGTP diphosphatase
MNPEPVQKVLAYITREQNSKTELLVFRHKDHPEAGLQVPAGTVGPDEPIRNALLREIIEETGLECLRVTEKLGEWTYFDRAKQLAVIRHVYHLKPDQELPDSWSHTVLAGRDDAGMVFDYFWIPLKEGPDLAGDQGRYIPARLDAALHVSKQSANHPTS